MTMGHQLRTLLEGAGLAVVIALLTYAGDNMALLLGGDRKQFLGGAVSAGIGALIVYVKARYATPPDVKERLDAFAAGKLDDRRAKKEE